MVEKNRGADAVMRALKAAGVDTIFTLSGNHIMSLFDAAVDTGHRLIHTRHEAAAVHMADAYGRLTGKPGVAMVTGGPGHANASAALFTALGADSPLVLLSGHAPTTQLGWGAFQELDQAAMAAPVAKASWTAAAGDDLAQSVAQALEIAVSGRPGPVHLSLPSDLLDQEAVGSGSLANADKTVGADGQATPEDWRAVATAVQAAKRPVIVAGPVFARAELKERMFDVARLAKIPCIVQESPRGLNDPSIGAFADVLAKADLVILANKAADFTVRFGQAPDWSPDARMIAISADPDQLTYARDRKGNDAITILSDGPATLEALARLEGVAQAVEAGWADEVEAAVAYRPAEWQQPQQTSEGRLHPLDLCGAIAPLLEQYPDAVLICDGGEIGQWAQANLSSRRMMTNSVTGSIGASLPFAMASRVVEPSAPVIAVMGDGTVGFHLAEFETAVRCGLPMVIVVGNDANWNAEYQIQLTAYGQARAKGCELLPAAYDEVCRALGGFGARVTSRAELDDALTAAIASGLPACINVMLDGRGAPKVRLPA